MMATLPAVVHQPRELLHLQRARLEVFGADEHDAVRQRLFGGTAVDIHERHARLARDFRHARRRRRIGGIHDDRRGILRDEVLNLAELPADVALRIGEAAASTPGNVPA